MKKNNSPKPAAPARGLRGEPQGLNAIFTPRSVAVIGATEKAGSVGRTLLWNLIRYPFGGVVYPVNPKRANGLGIKAYPRIAQVPDQVDLAVVVTPSRAWRGHRDAAPTRACGPR